MQSLDSAAAPARLADVTEDPEVALPALAPPSGRRARRPARKLAPCGTAPRVLLLATDYTTPYRVLRVAAACGAEVYVLGNAGAWPLRWSRHCRRLIVSERIIHGERDESLALEINCLVRELQLDMVAAADAPCARALIASRDLLDAPCFPLPTLAQFDLLNDKWAFAQLCSALRIAHPATQLLGDITAVRRALAVETVQFPLIVKPLGRCASSGIRVLRTREDLQQLEAINYRPILLQQFLPGDDIGASVYAAGGAIRAFIAHRLCGGEYRTFRDDRIYTAIGRLVAQLQLDGVYNFDMIRTRDGSVFYLECNPRFFYKIDLSMLAGVNFFACGLAHACGGDAAGVSLAPRVAPEVSVRFPKALVRSLLSSGHCSRRDWALSRHLLADPVPWMMEKLGVLR